MLPQLQRQERCDYSLFSSATKFNDTNAIVQIDFDKAAADFGSASVDSFKRMISNSFKKVEAAETNAANGESVAPPTPAKAGKKRKAAAEVDDEEGEETAKPKAKRGRKVKTPAVKTEGTCDACTVIIVGALTVFDSRRRW